MKLYVLLSMILLSCSSVTNINMPIKSEKNNSQLLFDTLIEDQMGGYVTPELLIIKDRESLLKLYGQVNKTRKPGFPIPNIDFSVETIVAVFMGEKNAGGYGVAVEEVKEKNGKLTVFIKETKPNPGDMVITVMTQPFCVIKINSSDKEIVFEKR